MYVCQGHQLVLQLEQVEAGSIKACGTSPQISGGELSHLLNMSIVTQQMSLKKFQRSW